MQSSLHSFLLIPLGPRTEFYSWLAFYEPSEKQSSLRIQRGSISILKLRPSPNPSSLPHPPLPKKLQSFSTELFTGNGLALATAFAVTGLSMAETSATFEASIITETPLVLAPLSKNFPI